METIIPERYNRLILPEGGVELYYRILTGSEAGMPVYSLYVTMEGEGIYESDFIFDLTRSRIRAEHILDLMSRNTVTPCTLRELLPDIL